MTLLKPSFILSASDLQTSTNQFSDYYQLNSGQQFTSPLQVNWLEFKTHALAGGISEQSLAIRFIYGLQGESWVVTCQTCLMETEIAPNTYSIKDETIFYLVGADFANPHTGDAVGVEEYFNTVVYRNNVDESFNSVVQGSNVGSIIYPFQTLQQLLDANKVEGREDEGLFTLKMNGIVLDYLDNPGSVVPVPHAIGYYMAYNGVDCLDYSTSGSLTNGVADYGSLCPANCGQAIIPSSLLPHTIV